MPGVWAPGPKYDGFEVPQYGGHFQSSAQQARRRSQPQRNTYPPFEHLIRLELLIKNAILPHLSDVDTDGTSFRDLVPYYHAVVTKQQEALLQLIQECCHLNDSAVRIIFGSRRLAAGAKVTQILSQLAIQSLDEPAYKRWISLRRFEDFSKSLQDHYSTPLLVSKDSPNPFRTFVINTVERFLLAIIVYTLYGWLRADLARLSELLIENWERNLHHSFAGRYPAFGTRDIFKLKSQMVLMIRALPVLRHLQFVTEYGPYSPAGFILSRGRDRPALERKRIQIEFILPEKIQEVISYVTLRSLAHGQPAIPIPPFWPEHENDLKHFLDAAELPVMLVTHDSKKPGHIDMKLSDNSSSQRFAESLSRVGKVTGDKVNTIKYWARHIPPEDGLEYNGDEDRHIKWERAKEKRFRTFELKQAKGEESYFPKVAKQMQPISSIVSRIFKM